MATKLFGGWYPNPAAGGKVERWWNNWGWTNGDDPTGGRGDLSPDQIQQLQAPAAAPAAVSTPQQSVDQIIKNSFQNLQTEANQKFKDYNANNPFNFDQVLADKTTQAKEQIDPYYNETLSDYLLGVNRKIERGKADTTNLLGELGAQTKSFSDSTQLKLTEAINNAKQGYADAGLFDSGSQLRSGGLLGAQADQSLSDFNRTQNYRTNQATTGLSRNLEDLSLGRTQDVRNLERSRTTDISTRAGDLTKEAGQQYVTGFNQTLPPELQANNNFDLLKQIGIYS